MTFRKFLDRIVKHLKNLKNSPASVPPLEAKILVQTVGLFIYMSHKSMTLLAEKDRYNSDNEFSSLINEMFLALGGDPNATTDSQYAKSKYNDLNELLDHLAFLPPEGDLSTRLSYLDSYSNLGVHHLALEAFGNLQSLGKSLRDEDSYRGDKYWFNSLTPLVKKRLGGVELDGYFSTQLPDYCLQVQIICTRRDDQSHGQLSTNLSAWASEKCVKNFEKIVKEGPLDTLLKESPRKEYAKDQLVNYYMGWHMLWFQSFYDAAYSHEYSLWMSSDVLNRDSIKQMIKPDYFLNVFNVEESEALDPQKKELMGFLFFLGLTYIFDVVIYVDEDEKAKSLATLASYYFNPKMVDFYFLYRLNYFLKEYSETNLSHKLLDTTFVKRAQLLDIWFGDNLFECDSGPAMTIGDRRWPSQDGYSRWWAMPVISPYFGVYPYFAQGYNQESERYDEGTTPGIIAKFQEMTKKMQERVDKFNDLAIGVLQGKIDPLSLGVFQRRLETQLGMYPDIYEACKWHFRQNERKTFGQQALKILNKDLGILGEKDRFYQIFHDRNNLKTTMFDAKGFQEIVSLINSLGENALKVFSDPKDVSSLSKKEIDNIAQLNYYFMNFDQSYEKSNSDLEKYQQTVVKIYTDEKFNPSELIDALYKLMSLSVPTEDKGSIEFPEFSLIPKSNLAKKSLENSLLGYLLYAFIREDENPNKEVIGRIFEALNSRLDSVLSELNNLSTSSNEAQISSTLTNISRWIGLTNILGGILGERTDNWGSESAYKGWSDFICNKNLVNKLPKLISVLEEKFKTLSSNLPKDAEKKKIDLLYSIVKLGSNIKSKVFSNNTSEVAKEINGMSLSLEDKKNVIANLAAALTEMFLNLNLSDPITPPEIHSLIPSEYNEKILSLLVTEEIPEEVPEDEKQEEGEKPAEGEENKPEEGEKQAESENKPEEGEQNQEEGENKTEEKDKLSEEDIKKQYFNSWRKFITANYRQFISQLLLAFSKASSSTNSTFEEAVKAVFMTGISKEKHFQEFIESLHKEAERVFEAFTKEGLGKLAELKTDFLPKVNSNQKSGINSLFSTVFYSQFHEKVLKAVPEEHRTFVPATLSEEVLFASSSEINVKFTSLLDEKALALYKKGTEHVFPLGLKVFTEKPSENRLKKNAELYETPSNEFHAAQLKDIELIYQEAKKAILNGSIYTEYAKRLDCANLLITMIWSKEYAEKAAADGIFEHIFKLEGTVNTTILPFIVEMAIGDQIPLENRIEIALKAALLRAASVKELVSHDTIVGLKPLLLERPNLFRKIYQELFTAKELSNAEEKSTSDYSVTLKYGQGNYNYSTLALTFNLNYVDWTSLSQGGDSIVEYLNNSLSQLSKTIVKQLVDAIVVQNEKIWREMVLKDQKSFSDFKNDSELSLQLDHLQQSLLLMNLLLRKYPELRAFASEIKVSTHIFDTTTIDYKELSAPQELTFFDYAIHVIQPPSFPLNAGIVTSFFERGTTAFTLKQGDEVITSHEYFARLAIQKCLNALRVLSDNKELEIYKRRQLNYVYAQTIRNALRTNWKASRYVSQTNLETISQLEEIVADNLSKGRTLADLFELTEVLRIQVHDQMVNAYAHLNLPNAQEYFLRTFVEFTKEEYACIRSIFHFDREYSKLDNYTNKIESNFKDIHLASKIDESKSGPLKVTSIEDPDRKALLVKNIIQGSKLSNKLAFSTGCPWDAYLKNHGETSTLTNSAPGSDPFRKMFEMFRGKNSDLANSAGAILTYADTDLGKVTSNWDLNFTREIQDKRPKPKE